MEDTSKVNQNATRSLFHCLAEFDITWFPLTYDRKGLRYWVYRSEAKLDEDRNTCTRTTKTYIVMITHLFCSQTHATTPLHPLP